MNRGGLMPVLTKNDANSGKPVGQIKAGEKKISANGKEYPSALNYFIATGRHAAYFEQAYPQKPATIEILFTGNDNDIDERFEATGAGGKFLKQTKDIKDFELPTLAWHGNPDLSKFALDGQGWVVCQSPKGTLCVLQGRKFYNLTAENEWKEYERGLPDIKGWPQVVWKRVLELHFYLPLVSLYGLWSFRTSGFTSIEPMRTLYLKCKEEFGRYFSKVIFDLSVEIVKTSDGRQFPIFSLVANPAKALELKNKSYLLMAAPTELRLDSLPEAPQQLQISAPETPILEATLENDYAAELEAALAND